MFSITNRLIKLMFIFLSILLILISIISLSWRFQHDSPIMLYIVFLIDRFSFVPYRDIFDMNMPGTYFAYFIIEKLFGFTTIGIRLADLIIMVGIFIFNWLCMQKINRRAAWFGSVLWSLLYLGFGPIMSLQREYLILLPIITGLLIYSLVSRSNLILRNLSIGFFFGLAMMMKPQAAIGFPLLVFWDFPVKEQKTSSLISRLIWYIKTDITPAAIGFLIPMLVTFLYLMTTNSLNTFIDMAVKYWPLYTHLTGDHKTISGLLRIKYLFRNYIALGNFGILMVPALISTYFALYDSSLDDSQKRQIKLLAGFTICYSIYPVFTGQFWSYHWLLFLFFIVQMSSLSLINHPANKFKTRHLIPIFVFIFVLFRIMPINFFESCIEGKKLSPLKNGRVDKIANFLNSNLHNGDLVQPLDWTGGAIHAMLISKARIATPFVYDFHFYHHISNQYIQNLRKIFIKEIESARPRFIIQITDDDKPWVSGENTTREFKELTLLLCRDYYVVSRGTGYLIYELSSALNNSQ